MQPDQLLDVVHCLAPAHGTRRGEGARSARGLDHFGRPEVDHFGRPGCGSLRAPGDTAYAEIERLMEAGDHKSAAAQVPAFLKAHHATATYTTNKRTLNELCSYPQFA